MNGFNKATLLLFVKEINMSLIVGDSSWSFGGWSFRCTSLKTTTKRGRMFGPSRVSHTLLWDEVDATLCDDCCNVLQAVIKI